MLAALTDSWEEAESELLTLVVYSCDAPFLLLRVNAVPN